MEFMHKRGVPGWIRPNGEFMPIIGGAQDDPPDPPADDDPDDDDPDDDDADDKGGNNDDIKDPVAKLKAESEKNERLTRRLKKEQEDRVAIEKRLKELEAANKSDDEKTADELKETREAFLNLGRESEDLLKENHILKHDKLVGLSGRKRKLVTKLIIDEVTIDDEGESNLDELLEELEKDEPDLFKLVSDDDDEEEEPTPRPKAQTGTAKKKRDKGAIDDAALANRFPTLKRRMRP